MTKERVYVKVSSDFDSTGYMQPTSITWSDGRTFPIETVRDFRPAGTADNGYSGDCFTVLIQGQEKEDKLIQSHDFFKICDITSTAYLPHTGNSWFDGDSGSMMQFIFQQFVL